MQWSLDYMIQSGLWLLFWLAAGGAVALTAHRRGR